MRPALNDMVKGKIPFAHPQGEGVLLSHHLGPDKGKLNQGVAGFQVKEFIK